MGSSWMQNRVQGTGYRRTVPEPKGGWGDRDGVNGRCKRRYQLPSVSTGSGDFEDILGFGGLLLSALSQPASDGVEGRGMGRIGPGEGDGHTGVAALADLRVSSTEPRNGILNCFAVRSAPPREKMSISWWQCGQVKWDMFSTMPENFDVDLVEHLEGFASILERDVGGSGDDDGAGEGHGLHERDDDIAGAGGQVDEEDVELTPLHLLQELADDLVEHGAAHDQGLVAGGDEADGDDFDPVRQVGLDLVVGPNGGLARGAEHQRHIGAVDVGVNEADAIAQFRQSDGEIDRQRGLADAAFAGSDGDDGLDSGESGGRRRCGG